MFVVAGRLKRSMETETLTNQRDSHIMVKK